MCIEVVIERGVLETEGVGGYFVCLQLVRGAGFGLPAGYGMVSPYGAVRKCEQVGAAAPDHGAAGAC